MLVDWVVVWVVVWVEVTTVWVVVIVLLCKVATNLLCEGRLMVGEIGLCLICWSSGSMVCSSLLLFLSMGSGVCGQLDLMGSAVDESVRVGSESAIALRSRVC